MILAFKVGLCVSLSTNALLLNNFSNISSQYVKGKGDKGRYCVKMTRTYISFFTSALLSSSQVSSQI